MLVINIKYMKRILNVYIWSYIINIIIFGVLYFIIGNICPESFIVNKEMNIDPFAERLVYDGTYVGLDLIDYYHQIKGIRDSLELVDNQLAELNKRDSLITSIVDSLFYKNATIRDRQIKEYETPMTLK